MWVYACVCVWWEKKSCLSFSWKTLYFHHNLEHKLACLHETTFKFSKHEYVNLHAIFFATITHSHVTDQNGSPPTRTSINTWSRLSFIYHVTRVMKLTSLTATFVCVSLFCVIFIAKGNYWERFCITRVLLIYTFYVLKIW